MVILKFHQFEVYLTVIQFEVDVIWSSNSKFVVIQSKLSLLIKFSCNSKTLY